MKVLITGVAGFIGMHCALRLLERGYQVIGIDNLNDYYDVALKEARLARLTPNVAFSFIRAAIEDRSTMDSVFADIRPERVINLAAQAGVRYSLENPHAYVEANLFGFINILEGCRYHGISHLVYASSSSVYGGNATMPFSESHNVDHPISLYAATKKSNELMAHTYSHLFALPVTGLRLFTVYGPWGRPDMALFKFAGLMRAGQPIDVYNHGQMIRDFTYIDDVVEAVIRVLDKPATANPDYDPLHPDAATAAVPFRLFNIGNGQPTPLMDYIGALERALGSSASIKMMEMQPGDVPATSADTSALRDWVGFAPNTKVEDGVARFAEWYLDYYGRKLA